MAGNKQADIVAAAIRLFHQKGFHATSMQDIADAVGLQKGSLYHYISSKEALLVVVVHGVIAQYNARLAEVKALDLPVRQRMELAIRNHLGGIADNLSMLTVFLRESYALNAEQQQEINVQLSRYDRMFADLYQEGVQRGELRPLDPQLVTKTVLGACNWFYRWYRPEGPQSMDALAAQVIDLVFGGITAERSASR